MTGAIATGIATLTDDGAVLDTWFPEPALDDAVATTGTDVLDLADVPADLEPLIGTDEARGVKIVAVRTSIADISAAPIDAHDVYLRLHLLSHRLVAPHGINLDGQFGLLTNVVWTNHGPCAVEGFENPPEAAGAWAGHRNPHRQVPAHGRLRDPHRRPHR